jgi:hypothetical protein
MPVTPEKVRKALTAYSSPPLKVSPKRLEKVSRQEKKLPTNGKRAGSQARRGFGAIYSAQPQTVTNIIVPNRP